MSRLTRDPLLAIAGGLLRFFMALTVLAAAAVTVFIPFILLNPDKVSVELVHEGMHPPTGDVLGAICLAAVFAIALMGVLFWIFRLLKQIVDTVAAGDPFVPDNARRLTQMAWLTLAVQLVTLPIAAMDMWLKQQVKLPGDSFTFDAGIDGNGLLLMLILFVLARVFRQGAAMRAELEGTV